MDAGAAPLSFDGLTLITSVEDSMVLNHSQEPAVIISASGMWTAGRVKHHLKFNISDSRNTVLFVGYQVARSLGRVIQAGTSPVRIFGDWYPVEAEIQAIEGFSAHADLDELVECFESLGGMSETYVCCSRGRVGRFKLCPYTRVAIRSRGHGARTWPDTRSSMIREEAARRRDEPRASGFARRGSASPRLCRRR